MNGHGIELCCASPIISTGSQGGLRNVYSHVEAYILKEYRDSSLILGAVVG